MKVRPQGLLWPLLGLLVGVLLLGDQPHVHALPEYATRTGEPCATCHVSPAGGGPRTARGALWLAQGRPDQVPQLPASVQSPTTETAEEESAGSDAVSPDSASAAPASPDDAGKALFDKLGCGGCHGAAGEGAFGPALNVSGADKGAEKAIRNGQGTMGAYDLAALSDADLASLLQYLQILSGAGVKPAAAGEVVPPAAVIVRPARQAEAVCGGASSGASTIQSCGGN